MLRRKYRAMRRHLCMLCGNLCLLRRYFCFPCRNCFQPGIFFVHPVLFLPVFRQKIKP
jgi:hypothetical protein